MAKAKHSPETTGEEMVTLHIPANAEFGYGDLKVTGRQLADCPVATVLYSISNGIKQSLVDAAAFGKADKEGKSDDEIAAMAHDARTKRLDAILTGTVGARVGGPRVRGIEAVIADVAEEFAIRSMTARGIALPKKGKKKEGEETFTTAMARIVGVAMTNPAFAERVKAEATRRFTEEVPELPTAAA